MKSINQNKIKLMPRQQSGMAALELAITCAIIVAMSLVCLDVCFVLVASCVNDRACRDAARAASQEDTAQKALDSATAMLKAHQTGSTLIGQTSLVRCDYNDNGGDPDIPNPTVTVETQTPVKMPVPVRLFGIKFGDNGSGDSQTIVFHKVYTFPIVKFSLDLTKADPVP